MSATYPNYASPAPSPYNPVARDARAVNRTPSPTPSEVQLLNQSNLFDFRSLFQKDKMFTKKYILYYVVGIVLIILGALFLIYDKQIVRAIQPAANWMHKVPGGWLIPIAIFFVISFPPLFGHEILAIVCGLVWGVWVGFAITAAGTLLGEIGNFYAFRYVLQSHAQKMETKNIQYACLAKLVREGGFKIALIVRYSFVPGHFSTAIFSVCGMNIFIFILAALLSMPKQFITVYVGTLLESDANGGETTKNKIASYAITAITIVVTVAAMWYIRKEVNRVKPEVIYARRKARQVKLDGDPLYQNSGITGSTDDTIFNPNPSDINLLNAHAPSDAPYNAPYQRWDGHGHAVGHATDPRVYAPQPRRADASFDAALIAPSVANAAGAGPARQGTVDTTQWAQQMNAADGPAYPLHSVSESQLPEEPLHNPFENTSSDTIVPPSEPIPARSPVGDYAFSSPHNSFQGRPGNQPSKAFSPPPPTYRE